MVVVFGLLRTLFVVRGDIMFMTIYACTDEDSNACRSCNATASLRLLVSMNEVKF